MAASLWRALVTRKRSDNIPCFYLGSINFGILFQTMYRDKDGATAPVQDLNVICHQIPVHLIFGGTPGDL